MLTKANRQHTYNMICVEMVGGSEKKRKNIKLKPKNAPKSAQQVNGTMKNDSDIHSKNSSERFRPDSKQIPSGKSIECFKLRWRINTYTSNIVPSATLLVSSSNSDYHTLATLPACRCSLGHGVLWFSTPPLIPRRLVACSACHVSFRLR